MDFNFKYPTLEVQKLIHKAKNEDDKENLRKYLVSKSMLSTYNMLVSKNVLQENKQDLLDIKANQEKELGELYELKDKDPENASYLKNIDITLAEKHAQYMNVDECFEMMRLIVREEVSLSLQMDVFLCKIRIGIILKSKKILEENITLAREVCERGCDWDRRNKFKIYYSMYHLRKGNFNECAELLSDCLPSFEDNEVVALTEAVQYMLFSGLLSFDRKGLKSRLLNCPELHSVGCKEGMDLLHSLYECNYYDFLPCLYKYLTCIKNDFYLTNFINHFCVEMKIRVYKQLLDSYKSLDLKNMSDIFGIESEYLENDLCTYISEKRIQAKIDKVANTIVRHEERVDVIDEFTKSTNSLLDTILSRIE